MTFNEWWTDLLADYGDKVYEVGQYETADMAWKQGYQAGLEEAMGKLLGPGSVSVRFNWFVAKLWELLEEQDPEPYNSMEPPEIRILERLKEKMSTISRE
jgi:hypothetical protein